jgi:hypothetical protein
MPDPKEMIGMYVWHRPYGGAGMDEQQKQARRAEQSRRVASKRQARKNGRDILARRVSR